MQSQARVVIVGGGIMGASLLYHLAREGWSDCLLIEKGELTSGSTWHAAGQITHGLAHWGLAKMNAYGVELYQRLEAETGQSLSWHGCGSLRMAYNDDEMDSIRHTLDVGRGIGGVRMQIIGPDEIRKIHPFFNLDGVQAALHTPDDGHVDPAGATFALAKGARDRGAKVIRHCRVLNIEAAPNGQWRVITEQGDISCQHVVNAGGTYARQIGEWVGYDLPMANTTHHYFVTDTVPEFAGLERELPVVRDDMTYSGYIRMEQQSALIGIYEKTDPPTIWDDGTPWEVEHELFEADYDRIMPFLEKAIERMPILAERGIKREVHGAIPMPPDGQMLLGPTPGLENFWNCCGSHVGIAWGPGAGKYLAQWMVHGSAEINMRDFDPRRFPVLPRDYQIQRAKEDYVLRHEIPYPGRQRYRGRPQRSSPLYQQLKASGAVHEEIFATERPRWFDRNAQPREDAHDFRRAEWWQAVAEECRAVGQRVGVMDLSAFGKIEVRGADAAALLDRCVANRLPQKAGGIVLTHILNRRGTIEAEVTIARIDEQHYYLMFALFSELRVRDWLEQHRRDGEKASVEVVSRDFGCLVLSGPRSREVLGQLTAAPLDNAGFPWLRCRQIEVAGQSLRALRMSYQGELGWELHVPMPALKAVYDAIWAAGKAHGIANFGSYALNSMRLEKGFKGATELTNEVTLPEADVMRFVRVDKGEFIGRERTIASMQGEKPWLCAHLRLHSEVDCIGSETVFFDGRPVGQISSGGYGHRVQMSLAYAYLKPEAAAPGTELEVQILGEKRRASVLGEPPYDPMSKLPRSDA